MNMLKEFFLIALFLTFFPACAMASERQETTNLQSPDRHAEISQRRAISIAQQHIKGRVLDIRRNENIYRVKILSDQGSIHVIQVGVIDGKIKSGH